MKSKLSIAFIFALIIALSAAGQAKADTLTYELDFQFNATGTDPGATAPWLKAVFDDSYGGANTVRLTLDVLSIDTGEFVSDWYFNFDDNLDAANLSISIVDQTDIPTFAIADFLSGSAECSPNNCRADGDGNYDMNFDFDTAGAGGGVNRFTDGEQAIFDITYSAGNIDVYSFIDISEMGGGQGTYNTAAHVLGITRDASGNPLTMCGNGFPINDGINNFGSCSGWIANGSAGTIVPEPISSTLFIVGGTFLAGRRYFRRKK